MAEAISVSSTKLLAHIVADALPAYEQAAQRTGPLAAPGMAIKVPGVNDPRTASEIAADAAKEAVDAAAAAKRSAKVADAWENAAKAQNPDADKVPKVKKCPHTTLKLMSWGAKVCQDCGAVIKRP